MVLALWHNAIQQNMNATFAALQFTENYADISLVCSSALSVMLKWGNSYVGNNATNGYMCHFICDHTQLPATDTTNFSSH